jgi:hypothetical protein
MSVLCNGCGKELPSRSGGPGRRAAYHGATCRQRARRARLATTPDRTAVLAGLDRVEQVLVEARRAVITGQDPNATLQQLTAAVTALLPNGEPLEVSCTHADVTKSVTLLTETSGSTARPATAPAEHAPVTDQVHDGQPRAVTAVDVIDPDTVQLTRGSDFEFSGSYQVLATVRDEVVFVGTLRRSGRAAWQALTSSFIAVSGGPWRTRQDALVHLLLNHDHVRLGARRRR